MSAAPESALIDNSAEEKAKAEEEAKKKATEAEEQKEKERIEREAKEEERIAKQKKDEEEREAKLKKTHSEIIQYYEDAQILDYIVATRDGGKNEAPLVAAAAMFNSMKQLLDIHFVQFRYKKSYKKQVLSSDEDFLTVIEQRQLAIESLFPTMIEG